MSDSAQPIIVEYILYFIQTYSLWFSTKSLPPVAAEYKYAKLPVFPNK